MRRPLLISHYFGFTGAPIALLNLAKSLKRLGENPVVMTLSGGPLRSYFLEAGIDVVEKPDPATVAFVIANTVVSVPAALEFKQYGVPVGAWLHESMYFFKILKSTPSACGLQNLDFALTPSRLQLDEFKAFLPKNASYQLRNVVEQELFRPDGGDKSSFAVIGQWDKRKDKRKGQQRLLRLVRDAKLNCAFTFIGANRPAKDEEKLIGPQHKFLGELLPEAARLEIARAPAVISCAEAEVQPLSTIEALMAGRPALISDIPAHRILADLIPNVFLFDRSSPASFKSGMQRLTDAVPDEPMAIQSRQIAKELFGQPAFDMRMQQILRIIRAETPPDTTFTALQDPYQSAPEPTPTRASTLKKLWWLLRPWRMRS